MIFLLCHDIIYGGCKEYSRAENPSKYGFLITRYDLIGSWYSSFHTVVVIYHTCNVNVEKTKHISCYFEQDDDCLDCINETDTNCTYYVDLDKSKADEKCKLKRQVPNVVEEVNTPGDVYKETNVGGIEENNKKNYDNKESIDAVLSR
uniref:ZP domain-containing protein n=1 Tax=Parastrongyloides trichosuri TaxID=131310 RepID=A0A0N5A7H2_PARTI